MHHLQGYSGLSHEAGHAGEGCTGLPPCKRRSDAMPYFSDKSFAWEVKNENRQEVQPRCPGHVISTIRGPPPYRTIMFFPTQLPTSAPHSNQHNLCFCLLYYLILCHCLTTGEQGALHRPSRNGGGAQPLGLDHTGWAISDRTALGRKSAGGAPGIGVPVLGRLSAQHAPHTQHSGLGTAGSDTHTALDQHAVPDQMASPALDGYTSVPPAGGGASMMWFQCM